MEIKAITIKTGHEVHSQCKNTHTYKELLNSIDIDVEIAVHFIDVYGNIYNVDINKLHLNLPELGDTWEEFEYNVTLQLAMTGYMSDLRVENVISTIGEDGRTDYVYSEEDMYQEDRIRIVPTEALQSIDIKRGSIQIPDDIDNSLLNLKNNDLRIKISDSDAGIINLENSICVINGKAFYPLMFEGDMWVTQCVDTLSQTSGDAFFIDFTNVGGHTLYKFSELNYELLNNVLLDDQKCSGTVSLSLPTDVTMYNKTPLLVIEGRIFFPNEFNYTNSRVTFDLTKFPIEAMLVSDYGKDIKTTKSSGTDTEIALKDVIEKKWADVNYTGSFLILVNSELLIHQRTLYNTFIESAVFDQAFTNQSLLVKQSTREFVNYVQDETEYRYLLSFKPSKDQMLLSRDMSTLATYGKSDPRMGLNLKHGYYTVLNIKKR